MMRRSNQRKNKCLREQHMDHVHAYEFYKLFSLRVNVYWESNYLRSTMKAITQRVRHLMEP